MHAFTKIRREDLRLFAGFEVVADHNLSQRLGFRAWPLFLFKSPCFHVRLVDSPSVASGSAYNPNCP